MKTLLDQIINLINSDLPSEEKHNFLSLLWEKVLKSNDSSYFHEIYNLFLCSENVSYIINQEPDMNNVSDIEVEKAIIFFKVSGYFRQNDIDLLLNWSIYNTRKSFQKLGILLENNSLNGLCELSERLTIHPFEDLGLSVTKNKASECFDYPGNHNFGTVTFPIMIDGNITFKTYLLDATYRQFFTTVRCNKGMYYINPYFDHHPSPDPGYFVDDVAFAKELMKNGYVELNDENAYKYGHPFFMSSLKLNEKKEEIKDYKNNILTHPSDYTIEDSEGLIDVFPRNVIKNRIR